ncbi:hypothetical protein RJ55_01697 [Drechmeria coniospora]|nr:hypothetical protein RJ55_01697 [Drechmeria coniospora]
MNVTAGTNSSSPGYLRSRIANACDGCKARKVKCDGLLPCGYCTGRQRPHTCHYTPQRKRRPARRPSAQPSSASASVSAATSAAASASFRRDDVVGGRDGLGSRTTARDGLRNDGDDGSSSELTPAPASTAAGTPVRTLAAATTTDPRRSAEPSTAEDDTDVPREARLLRDAHGKLIFIGDCAPLSFFQSVRQLVTSRVGQNAFAPESSRYSVLENAAAGCSSRDASLRHGMPPRVQAVDVPGAVAAYLSTTTSLVDLFGDASLVDELLLWASLDASNHGGGHHHHHGGGHLHQHGQNQGHDHGHGHHHSPHHLPTANHHQHRADDVVSAVNYLVLAIGFLSTDEETSRAYFDHGRDGAYASLCGSLGVETVQAFALITIYMLCSCQINGAFLFFGISVRAAYSVGVHRTEVNARFGPEVGRQRDRLWKSLRVVDLYLSTSMGRPPVTSDVDCTVPYRSLDADGNEVMDLLNASVQILLITESIVLEIYSRRKVSLQLTEGISHQLRDWSVRWLQQLKGIVARPEGLSDAQVIGACQVLSSYYYSVMLVSRPFLMHELFRRLSDGPATAASAVTSSSSSSMAKPTPPTSGKSKLADACIDAASLMVDAILDLIDRGTLNGRVPLIISWLFASSLVLGVGLLGGFGRTLEKHSRMSIRALDHFAKTDGHAAQYSLIAQSLLTTALEHLDRRELQERLRRTESSSQLFGLMPPSLSGPGFGGHQPPPVLSPSSTVPPQEKGGFATGSVFEAAAAAAAASSSLGLQPQPPPQQGAETASPSLAGSTFLGLTTESLMQTPDGDYWHVNGDGGDVGSALNLFPLLEAGGGIDLAHYL